jgi:hypothetical protein
VSGLDSIRRDLEILQSLTVRDGPQKKHVDIVMGAIKVNINQIVAEELKKRAHDGK